MRKNILTTLIATVLLTLFMPVYSSLASTYTFESDYIEAELLDHTLVMTSETPKYSEVWAEANITDINGKLDEFRSMNIMAFFYNKDTRQSVSVIRNNTQETVDAFSFAEMSESEILKFAQTVGASSESEDIKVEVSVLNDVAEFPCFRLFIDARATENPCSEVVYGIVMNAQIFQFDSYSDGAGYPDEEYLKEIIGSFHWTRQLTREEYSEMVHEARVTLALIALGIFVVLGGLIALAVLRRSRRNKRNKAITAAMADFREKKAAGQFLGAQPDFWLSTAYDEAIFNDYATYIAWIRPALSYVISVVFLAAILILLLKADSYMYALFMFAIIVVISYLHYTQTEKIKEGLLRRYDVKSHPTATFRFYSEYFEVSGLRSAGQYIYKQITAIRSFKDSIYVYIGDDTILVIRKKDITEEQFTTLKCKIK